MAVLRGYVFDQWPKNAIEELGLSAEQMKILDNAKKYAVTGVQTEETSTPQKK